MEQAEITILLMINELKNLYKEFEKECDPSVLENIKSNMETNIKSYIELKEKYPNTIYKLRNSDTAIKMIKNQYNERICFLAKKSLKEYKIEIFKALSEHHQDVETKNILTKIRESHEYLDRQADNYQESIKLLNVFHDNVEDLYSNIIHNDLDIYEAFSIVIENGDFKNYMIAIAELIRDNKLNKANLDNILRQYFINKITDIKLDLLNLLLSYIYIVITSYIVTERESRNIKTLKLYFKIKEGDFYKYKYNEIKSICQEHFARISRNMDYSDELFWVEIQDMFDLSYSQIEKLKK